MKDAGFWEDGRTRDDAHTKWVDDIVKWCGESLQEVSYSAFDRSKGRYSSSWEPHLRATRRHLPYGITQCYLLPDTNERAPPNPSHAGWYSIYLRRRDGRLSWPSWLDSAPARSRTSDLSITSPTPNRCTTKIDNWSNWQKMVKQA